VTKGAGSRTAGLAMAFKLLQVAEGHWRNVEAAELVPLVRAGVHFEDGVQIEPQKKRGKRLVSHNPQLLTRAPREVAACTKP
jgi:hypothetical protein